MIEKIVTSKTRVKLLNLFLTHIDDRYYLRELERKLDESLSPLRRQLLKLVEMGILVTEEEANLKYYKMNKNFEGMDELRKLVLGQDYVSAASYLSRAQSRDAAERPMAAQGAAATTQPDKISSKRVRYDFAVLTAISVFVLVTAIYVVYTSTSSMKQVTGLISSKPVENTSKAIAKPTRPDEMVSKSWKVISGSVPVLSTGNTEETRKSKEL